VVAGEVTIQFAEPSLAVLDTMVDQFVPPFRDNWMLTLPVRLDEDQVMFREAPADQLSPPLGDKTVMLGELGAALSRKTVTARCCMPLYVPPQVMV
jgi:hypothetical protein